MEHILERPTLRDQIYDILKKSIILREIKPGDKINEEDLAKTLQVSRTPIRESLLRLEHEGIVQILPRRGAFVASVSEAKTAEVFQVREVLEGLVARLATMNMNDEILNRLKICLENATSIQNNDDRLLKYTPADIEFHGLLLEACNNDLLKSLMQIVNAHLQMVRLRTVVLPGRPEQTVSEHHEIFEAMERRDARSAEKLMRKHVESVRKDALKDLDPAE
jgi:DNA-binding GntR family transcriptional regulator